MEDNLGSNGTNCSGFQLTDSHIIWTGGSLGVVSAVTCLFALSWLFYLKLHRQFIYRLAAYQVMASLLHALIIVCQFSFLKYGDSKYPACVAVGYLFMMAGWVKVCFGCWITFHLFCFAVLLKNMRRLEPLYVVSSILFPAVVSSIPLTTESYGPTGEWCAVQGKRCGNSYLTGVIEQVAVWYGPASFVFIVQSFTMIAMVITVYYRARRKSGENVFGRDQSNKAFIQLLPLVAYPILFCVLVIPPLVDRVLAGYSTLTPNRNLIILSALCVPSWSFFAGLVLIVHIGALKCTEVIGTSVRAAGATGLTEHSTGEYFQTGIGRVFCSHKDLVTRSSTYFSTPREN